MWFWIWSALVIGALVCAFVTWRGLWRRGKRTLRTVGEASVLVDVFSQRSQALAADPPGATPRPLDVLADPLDLAELVAERRRVTRARRAARLALNQDRYDRWRRIDM